MVVAVAAKGTVLVTPPDHVYVAALPLAVNVTIVPAHTVADGDNDVLIDGVGWMVISALNTLPEHCSEPYMLIGVISKLSTASVTFGGNT